MTPCIERDAQGLPVRMWLVKNTALSKFVRSPAKVRRAVWERVIVSATASQMNLFKD